jgi:Spy/CpxP family protein refolding chaperone
VLRAAAARIYATLRSLQSALTPTSHNRLTGFVWTLIKEITMRFRKAILALALGSVAMTAGAAGGPDLGPGLFGMGGEGHAGAHGHHGHGAHRGGPGAMSPERMEARIDRMAERLIRSVEGTPEQREKVSAIAKAAAKDMRELRKQGGDLRRQGVDLLKAPSIDRAAIEALRSQQMAVADSVSRRMSAALADTAEVLTPEQRAKLAERMQSRRRHG